MTAPTPELFHFPDAPARPRKPRRSHLQKVCDEHVAEILTITKGNPALMCFAVSASLQGYLGFFEGIDCEMTDGEVEGCSHWWLTLLDGRIIDGTAGQFTEQPLPPVYIGPLPLWYRKLKP